MSRIERTFRRLRKANEAALIPYLPAGYPSLDVTRTLLPVIARQEADLIAFGPMAAEVTLADCLHIAVEARRSNEVPLLLVSTFALVNEYDPQRLAQDCASSGVDGLIVPDLPPEEADSLTAAGREAGVDLILAVTHDSTDEWLDRVAELASGFVLCALAAAVGAPTRGALAAGELAHRMRQRTDLPLVAYGGLGTPEQVAQTAQVSDGVMVEGELASLIESLPEDEVILGVSDYVRALKEAARREAIRD